MAIHLCGLPEGCSRRSGRAAHAFCSTLLRVGFAEPPGSLRTLVRSYRTVSPLPPSAAVSLCCTVRQVTPTWLSPAPCPMESRLSSTRSLPCRGHPADSPSALRLGRSPDPRFWGAKSCVNARFACERAPIGAERRRALREQGWLALKWSAARPVRAVSPGSPKCERCVPISVRRTHTSWPSRCVESEL